MIGVDKLPGFIMVLAGVDTGLTVGVFFTGQPNRWAQRQIKSKVVFMIHIVMTFSRKDIQNKV